MPQPSRLAARLAVALLALLAGGSLVPASAQELLYEQNGAPSGNGIPDQNFEDAFDEFDSEAADDFEVTWEHGWDLTQVRTTGSTDEGDGGGNVALTVYANSLGGGRPDLPGAEVCIFPQLTTTTFPNLSLALPTPCHLPPGRYWLGIQIDQNYENHGQHFWSNTRDQRGSEGVWRNPGNGFERNCRQFKPQTLCLVGGANNPDLLFQIFGVKTPPPTTDLVLGLEGELPHGTIFVKYDLKLVNNGPLDASSVVVHQTLPEGCVFERSTCGSLHEGGWRWDLGQLAKGATAECELRCDAAALPAGQHLMSTATVSAEQLITNPALATAAVEVITGPVPAVPTAGTAALATLAALLALAGAFLLRR